MGRRIDGDTWHAVVMISFGARTQLPSKHAMRTTLKSALDRHDLPIGSQPARLTIRNQITIKGTMADFRLELSKRLPTAELPVLRAYMREVMKELKRMEIPGIYLIMGDIKLIAPLT